MNKIKEYTEKVFEDIKHIDKEGNEYWLARELQQYQNTHNGEDLKMLLIRQNQHVKIV